jgi:hypothetical protein
MRSGDIPTQERCDVMKLTFVLGAACLSLAAAPVLAQTTETVVVEKKPSGAAAGAVAGAATGAVVAGPVGAVVGGVAGAVVGGAASPPTEVRTYVTGQTVAPVTYSGQVVVGQPIAGEVAWMEVPSYPKYRWAYLNGQRVVVDADTRAVVAVY